MATESEIRAARKAAMRKMMAETGKTMLATGTQYEPTYDDQTRAVLQEFETNPAYQYPAKTPAYEGGISDGVIGYLGFNSRDDYDQAMAAAAAAQANDTSGFVTGGGSPSPAPVGFQPQISPVGGSVINPVQQLTGATPSRQSFGASTGYSATPQMVGASGNGPKSSGGFYQSNLIRSLREATPASAPEQNSGVSFMPNTVNTPAGNSSFTPAPSSGLAFNPQRTVLDQYDPTPIFQEIYGRNPTSSELEYARTQKPANLRTTLEQSLAEWQAKQKPATATDNFTDSKLEL